MSAAITLLARFLAAVVAVFTLLQSSANAQEKLKIGIITTLSAVAGAVPGQQQRNGFELAVKMLGGKLGGREAEIVVADDELKPDVAVAKVKALVDRDRVAFVVGPIFSNILAAIVKPVTDANVFLISPNAGTSSFAGKGCNPNLFVTSYQNDQVHEVLGQHAQDSGYKKVIIIVPNYQAGKDAAAGFKHKFSGEIVDEIYVPLGQPDYSAELSRIAAASPDAIFAFLPGGMGVNFVKHFRQAGSDWAPSLDNPQNKAFVDEYVKEYNAVPATYAFQAYDAAMLIDSAVRAVKGNVADKDALRAALKKADFKSLRGAFKFNNNHYPIQDFYLTKV